MGTVSSVIKTTFKVYYSLLNFNTKNKQKNT